MADVATIRLSFGPDYEDFVLVSRLDLAKLSMRCAYFQAFLDFQDKEGSNRDSIDISHSEIDPAPLGQVIKTLLKIESDKVQDAVSLLEATIYLQCQPEIQAEMLIRNIDWSNCFQIFHIASEHSLSLLTEAAGRRCLDMLNAHAYLGHNWKDIMELRLESIWELVKDNVPSSWLSLSVILAWAISDPESRIHHADSLVNEVVVPELLSLSKPPLSCTFWGIRFPNIIAILRTQLRTYLDMNPKEQENFWKTLPYSRSTQARKKWPMISIVNDQYMLSNIACSGLDHWTVLSEDQVQELKCDDGILALNKVRDQGLARSRRWKEAQRSNVTSIGTPVMVHTPNCYMIFDSVKEVWKSLAPPQGFLPTRTFCAKNDGGRAFGIVEERVNISRNNNNRSNYNNSPLYMETIEFDIREEEPIVARYPAPTSVEHAKLWHDGVSLCHLGIVNSRVKFQILDQFTRKWRESQESPLDVQEWRDSVKKVDVINAPLWTLPLL